MAMSKDSYSSIGGRNSGRHGGATVPGASLSSSREGPVEGLMTGPSMENASVKDLEDRQEVLVGWRDTDPSGDDEMEVDIVRGTKRKNNRSRILDDSLEEIVATSPKEKQQKKMYKKGTETITTSEDIILVDIGEGGLGLSPIHLSTSTPQRSEWIRLREKPTESLAQIAIEWLDNIDVLRVKNGNIQGVVSGKMKKRILGLAEVIYILRARSAATGDALFLQKENTELEAKLRASRAAETRLKEDVKRAEGVIKELRKEAKELRERMGSESPSGGNEEGTRTGEAVRGYHRDPTPSQQDA